MLRSTLRSERGGSTPGRVEEVWDMGMRRRVMLMCCFCYTIWHDEAFWGVWIMRYTHHELFFLSETCCST